MNRQASCGGHGTLEILRVTELLNQSSIPCCVVGVSALMFYGVPRVRDKWEICLPDEDMKEAINALEQRPEYVRMTETQQNQPMSLAHMYAWFEGQATNYQFCLVPSSHARVDVRKIEAWRSANGVPYAPLDRLVQSYLDMNDMVSLCDIVDGADLSYEWGQKNLDLDGTTDVAWAQRMNAELMGGEGKFDPCLIGSAFPSAWVQIDSLWRKATRGKQARLKQMMLPHELFSTRYKLRSSPDEPWREKCDAC